MSFHDDVIWICLKIGDSRNSGRFPFGCPLKPTQKNHPPKKRNTHTHTHSHPLWAYKSPSPFSLGQHKAAVSEEASPASCNSSCPWLNALGEKNDIHLKNRHPCCVSQWQVASKAKDGYQIGGLEKNTHTHTHITHTHPHTALPRTASLLGRSFELVRSLFVTFT